MWTEPEITVFQKVCLPGLKNGGWGGVENMGVDLTVGSKAVSSPVALEVGGCRCLLYTSDAADEQYIV